MPRVKRSVHARKKRRTVLNRAKGYYGAKSRSYRAAKEQVQHSLQYMYRDRRNKKREIPALKASIASLKTKNRLLERRTSDLPLTAEQQKEINALRTREESLEDAVTFLKKFLEDW